MKPETLIERVQFRGIVDGEPPLLAFSKLLTRPDGKQKLHSQMVQVTDTALLARLRREVCMGEEVEVEIETDWTHPDIPTILKDFTPVAVPLHA